MAKKKKSVDPRIANRSPRTGPITRDKIKEIRDEIARALDLLDACDKTMESRGYDKLVMDGWKMGERGAHLLTDFTANLQKYILITRK